MKLIDTNDFLLGSHGLNRFRESLVSKLVMYILRLHKLDKLNVKVNDDDPEVLLDSLIEALGVTIEVSKEDLEKIPKNGTFITVSNHPFGGLDGIVLVRLLCKLRPDYKIMSNFLLKKIVPLQDYILGLDPEEGSRRLINLMTAWNNEIKEFMGGMGINSIEALRGNRMMLRGLGLTDRELQVLGIAHAGE